MGVRSPGTGIKDSCELPCGYWELNSGPLEEQPVLLTTEPSPAPILRNLNREGQSAQANKDFRAVNIMGGVWGEHDVSCEPAAKLDEGQSTQRGT